MTPGAHKTSQQNMAPPQPIVPLQRCLLLPVDDSDDSQRAFDWIIKNFYKPGDEVHLLNVISRMQFAATLGVPAVDFTPQINREAYEAAVRKAEAFIVKRFLARMPPEIQTTPIVHIIKSEVDSSNVGHVICQKAEELRATCVLMGSHNKGPVAEFFMGSVSQYVSHHCKTAVVIVKQP